MSKRDNGTEETVDGRTSLDLEETPESEASETQPGPGSRVKELGNDGKGCWKVLSDGKRVELTDKEWRKELTRLLAPAPPPS